MTHRNRASFSRIRLRIADLDLAGLILPWGVNTYTAVEPIPGDTQRASQSTSTDYIEGIEAADGSWDLTKVYSMVPSDFRGFAGGDLLYASPQRFVASGGDLGRVACFIPPAHGFHVARFVLLRGVNIREESLLDGFAVFCWLADGCYVTCCVCSVDSASRRGTHVAQARHSLSGLRTTRQ